PAPGAAGIGPAQWAACAGAGALALFGFGGLARGRTGRAWVLGLFGRYRGTVRRTGLLWVNPLLLRRRGDVRLRHWRSEPMPAADRGGVALGVVVTVGGRGGGAGGGALPRRGPAGTAPGGRVVGGVGRGRGGGAAGVAAARRGRGVGAGGARRRARVPSAVVDAGGATVARLTVRGLVEVD